MTRHHRPVSALNQIPVLVPGVLLTDPDGPVAFTARNVESIRENLVRPRTVLASGVTQEDLQRAIAEHDKAIEAALMAESTIARIALRSRPT